MTSSRTAPLGAAAWPALTLLGRVVVIAALAGAGMLCSALSPRAASAGVEALVTNYLGNSVTTYARTAKGDVAPLRVISGKTTGLQNPAGLAVDTLNKEILVANISSITVYGLSACGNAAPLRTISGALTGLAQPIGLAVDTVNNEVFVANDSSITVYRRTDDGNVVPQRTIQGASTGLMNPFGLAVDTKNGELLVANFGSRTSPPVSGSITVYSRTAKDDAAPIRTISGAATGLAHPIGLAVDPVNNEVLVANESSITVYARTGKDNVEPLRVIEGSLTKLDQPLGLGLDTANDEILVANLTSDADSGAVTVYDRAAGGPSGSPAANVEPRVISGPATLLTGPAFPVVAEVPAEFNFDFSGVSQVAPGPPKATCFRDLLRGNEITAGVDLGGTGHTSLNIAVTSGDAQNTWLTVYDSNPATPAPGPLFDAPQTVCADVLVVPFNNSKGAGVVTMLNEGAGKKGLALIIHEAGNTDMLRLATLDGDPKKKGQLTTLKSVSLQAGISGNTWYRLIMTVRLSPTPLVTGQVLRHVTPTDPNSPLAGQVGGLLSFSQGKPIAGVTSPGESGIAASSISAVLNASVTNFTNDAARCMR